MAQDSKLVELAQATTERQVARGDRQIRLSAPTEPQFGLPFSVAGAFGVGRRKGAACVVSIEEDYVEAH
jgi:hypothetical protein